MPTPKITLLTIDYPPKHGGVARYLKSLTDASGGAIEAIVLPDRSRWWQLVSICRSQSNVLLVSHVFPVGTAAWISRMLGGPEYAVLFHGLDLRQVKTGMKKWMLEKICATAKTLFVNSESTKRDLVARIPGARPIVITPGVADVRLPERKDARKQLGLDQDVPVVVSIARLISRKGIDVALQAMATIQKEHDEVYAVLGNGTDAERLHALAKQYGTRVRWVPEFSDEEKWTWLAAADVFLLPVRDEGDDVEGFGIVFLEAAIAGIPSVAGSSGGAVEAVLDGETGYVVDPASVVDVAEAVERVAGYEELRDQLGKKARSRALSDFQWKDRWDKLQDALS